MMPAARDSVVNNNQPNTEPGDPHGEPMRFYPGSGCYAAERLPPPWTILRLLAITARSPLAMAC